MIRNDEVVFLLCPQGAHQSGRATTEGERHSAEVAQEMVVRQGRVRPGRRHSESTHGL